MNKTMYWVGQLLCASPALVIGLLFSAHLVSTSGWLMLAKFWGSLLGFMAFIVIPIWVGSSLIQSSKRSSDSPIQRFNDSAF